MSMLFGTDGIRGLVNTFPIDPLSIVKIAQSLGKYFKNEYQDKEIVCIIGKDTRISGYMIECALVSGLVSMGINAILLGPIPTPAVSMFVKKFNKSEKKIHFGIMISASHNHFEDNGIKFFNPEGEKLTKNIENIIESYFFDSSIILENKIGKVNRLDNADNDYVEIIKNEIKKNLDLSPFKIVLDCANGASYKVAPKVFEKFNANLIIINNDPNGININKNCGSTYLNDISDAVIKHNADIGLALDGDGDRLLIVDEKGHAIPGELILGILAKDENVISVISNPALEEYLKEKGKKVIYSDVGDNHIFEKMKKNNIKIGGEPYAGHILLDKPCSDGIYTALFILDILIKNAMKSSELNNLFTLIPHVKKYIKLSNKEYNNVDVDLIRSSINSEKNLKSKIILRKSGTEKLLRVYMWNSDNEKLKKEYESILKIIYSFLKHIEEIKNIQ